MMSGLTGMNTAKYSCTNIHFFHQAYLINGILYDGYHIVFTIYWFMLLLARYAAIYKYYNCMVDFIAWKDMIGTDWFE